MAGPPSPTGLGSTPERRHQHRRRPAGLVQVGLQRRPRGGGVHDHRVRQRRHRLDAAQVDVGMLRPGIFGELDRDQVVHERDQPRPAGRQRTRDTLAPMQVAVRGEQVDRPDRMPPRRPGARPQERLDPDHAGGAADVGPPRAGATPARAHGGDEPPRLLQRQGAQPVQLVDGDEVQPLRGQVQQLLGIGELHPVDPGGAPRCARASRRDRSRSRGAVISVHRTHGLGRRSSPSAVPRHHP